MGLFNIKATPKEIRQHFSQYTDVRTDKFKYYANDTGYTLDLLGFLDYLPSSFDDTEIHFYHDTSNSSGNKYIVDISDVEFTYERYTYSGFVIFESEFTSVHRYCHNGDEYLIKVFFQRHIRNYIYETEFKTKDNIEALDKINDLIKSDNILLALELFKNL